MLAIDLAMIGDLVCATPALASLKTNYPSAQITVLASDSTAPVLNGNPDIGNTIGIDKNHDIGTIPCVLKNASVLRAQKFDIAFLFHNSFGSALVAALSGIPARIGYATELRGNLLTHRIAYPKERLHLAEERLNILRKTGLAVTPARPKVYCDHAQAEKTLARMVPSLDMTRPVVAISAGSTWPTKVWPRKNIQVFLNKLPVGSCSIILLGSAGETEYANGLSSISVPVHNLVGTTTLEELVHILDCADAVVAPDSGPMHIAAGLDKHVIGLFGPTDPKICGMLHDNAVHLRPNHMCLCCWEKKCRQRELCMDLLEADEVLHALMAVLEKLPKYAGTLE